MKKATRMLKLGALLSCAMLFAPGSAASEVDSDYPYLDAKELGQVRHMVALASQPDGDWTGMEIPARSAFDNKQFQLAWMYYALAVAQVEQTPAYRELYKAASVGLIRKMVLPEVWSLWERIIEEPRFKKYLDTSKDWRDPVAEKNIMYSGHLLQMMGLFEVLYDDHRYDEPGAITFAITGANPFTHSYNHRDLAELIHRQFLDNSLAGIECEPNFVFAECNQHPILGLIHYDQLHDDNLADIKGAFWEKAMELGYLDDQGSMRFNGPYLLKEESLVVSPSGWNDGWSGVTLHGWNKDLVQQTYPAQRDAELGPLLDKSRNTFKRRWNQHAVSTDYGFLAAYAAEVGDPATRETLLDFADANFDPIWRDGAYIYPLNDVPVPGGPVNLTGIENVPGGQKSDPKLLKDSQYGDYQLGPLTANALLPFARLNPGGSLWTITNNLSSKYSVNDPEIVNVDYPKVLVKRAYYDGKAGVLSVVMLPGKAGALEASFDVRRLPKNGVYDVYLDGELVATVSERFRAVESVSDTASVGWQEDGALNVAFSLASESAIRIVRTGDVITSVAE